MDSTLTKDDFTSNEEFDALTAGDNTVAIIGYVDCVEGTKIVGKDKKSLYKCIINNDTRNNNPVTEKPNPHCSSQAEGNKNYRNPSLFSTLHFTIIVYFCILLISISRNFEFMPKRKQQRTADDEAEFQRIRRERITVNQRRRREIARNQAVNPIAPEEIVIEQNRIIELPSASSIIISNVNAAPISTTVRQRQSRSRRNINSSINPERHLNDIHEHYIGTMDTLCSHCGAKHFIAEKITNKGLSFNDCCSHGEVSLETLPKPPSILYNLFNGSHPKSTYFYEHIRSYNNSFSFASFNANLFDFANRRPGPYCFKIQGQIYYQINTALYPDSNEYPTFGQLFIIDPNEAIEFRCHENSRLDPEIAGSLDMMMRESNIFAESYQMMGIELQNQQAAMITNNEVQPELQLLFTLKPGMDRGRNNFQRTNEVAVVFSTMVDGEIPESYVTVRNKTTKTLQYVSSMDPNVEPWIYPLLYPFGTRGWHRDLPCVNKNRRVTRAAYVKYRMAIRNDFNPFLMGRRLFQQWIVDSYVKIEKDRIEFCKSHQTQLRAESYQGLIDHLKRGAAEANTHVGKIVILPSTFVGSPRNMLQLYEDSMAIVRKYGKPDIFLTMACNPQWREIIENILLCQSASDRPDIVAWVFNIKKDYLLNLIVKQKVFGEVLAYVYVIEFQKRGLPHIHILITLSQNSKITTSDVVDRYISAEIPDPDKDYILHEIVMKNMIHGPCGDWCLVQGKCSKHYPKEFRNETTLDENGYPSYRRRDIGITFERRGRFVVDNRNAVPHSPILLRLLNCHINVEVVSSIKSVKYLYKYIHKGHDAAAVTVVDGNPSIVEHDEIRDYLETRYVGPVEACWRILSKPLHDKSHSITRLPVHLPNQQSIIIQDEHNEDGIRAALDKQSMLIDYFALNARDPQARQYVYGDIPIYYVFKKESGTNIFHWYPRKNRFNVIGRMYSISPTQTELFHLRLLLLTVKGATSFHNLRIVNDEVQETYVATCLALGLIQDDDEWKRAIHEAEVWMMPRQLRSLFVRLLIHCHPVHPNELWDEFKDAMSQDYARHVSTFQAHRKAYLQISAMLSTEGSSLAMFPDMEPISEIVEADDDILPQEARDIGNHQYEKLNQKQKEIVDLV
ncbi:uncharacterized protein LOC124410885 [Diprion similis]|uniref:uncharacterized protein LOC124410885 n=1 Tax=Diprion similis TaxID=362088 RepID=UPI001EF9498B|nr:uncharacterized protein LOC124410885 [Diprion similis]